MGLDIGLFRVEQAQHSVNGQALDNVDEFTAAVVAASWVALGILVRQDGALGGKDGWTGVILRGDHLQAELLTLALTLDRLPDFGVILLEQVHNSLHCTVSGRAGKSLSFP